MRKARNRSAPGPSGVPYRLCKRCPKTLYLLNSFIQRAWSYATVDDEWKKAGRLYSKGERLQGSESIQTHTAVECLGEITFLHHGVEAHRIRLRVRGHISPKGRRFRCSWLHRAYLDDLGGYPESQEELAESVRRIANSYGSVPYQFLWRPIICHSPLSTSFRTTLARGAHLVKDCKCLQ